MLDTLFTEFVFMLKAFRAGFVIHFADRTWTEWLFFFFPFYVFGEFPRYVVPAIGLMILKFFGLPRDDRDDVLKRHFMDTSPSVSILLVGYNEEDCIANAIESLLEIDYENMEVIVVDDNSSDNMYQMARPYADRGLIKLFKNTGASGRAGRPVASNMAFQMSTGDYILSVDSDTSFDRDALFHMIGPFYDPEVGVVAGNIKARNAYVNKWTRVQAIEYFQSITLWKTWLNIFGMNMQASGAFGAFRREALEACGAWDPELAEDADLSLKIKKGGWKIVFARQAIAMTNVPETIRILIGQRYRWDRGLLRTYFHKHANLLKFWRFGWKNALEMALEYFFSVFLTFLYVFWLSIMIFKHPLILFYVFCIAYFLYAATAVLTVLVALTFSERKSQELGLVPSALFFPVYKGIFRWVRLYALILETVRFNYEESYLPTSAWRNAKRW